MIIYTNAFNQSDYGISHQERQDLFFRDDATELFIDYIFREIDKLFDTPEA